MSESAPPPPPPMQVSPNSGLDPEIRQFVSRVMAGYEAAHRTVADLCEVLSKRAETAEGIAARSLELQMRLAEEREELLSRRHKRELETRQQEMREAASVELKRDAKAILMLAGKKFLGIPLTGNDSHGLQDLLATMTGEQIDSVVTSGSLQLSEPQRQLLMQVFMSLSAAEKANQLASADDQPKAAE